MGAYLSEPVTEKVSSDEGNDKLECGASSMQGWRVNQEDAHNTILDFDTNSSFFAVYDGHGGAEVATYCSQKLPDFIKNTDAYKAGDFVKALEDAFLGFDASIATKEVMDILKELAGEINPPGASDNDDSEDENVSNLYQEARLPLQEVLAKYENKLSSLHRAKLGDTATPMSPCLRAKKNDDEAGTADAGSSSETVNDAASSSKDVLPEPKQKDDDSGGVSSTNSNDDKEANEEVSTSENKEVKDPLMEVDKISNVPDSSEDNHLEPEQSENGVVSEASKSEVCNGDVTESRPNDAEEGITSSNGSATPSKGKTRDNGIDGKYLAKLTPDCFKELCPHLATRIKLQEKITEFISAQINIDFDLLYPEKGLNLYLKWDFFFEKLLQLKSTKDESIINLIDSLRNIEDELKLPTQILILAKLVPPKGRLSKKIKFTTQEAIESIFICVPNAGDIEQTIKQQKEKALAKKISIQPYIILQGTLSQCVSPLLIVDDVKYQYESIPKSFDTLFKIYHTFNARYPKAVKLSPVSSTDKAPERPKKAKLRRAAAEVYQSLLKQAALVDDDDDSDSNDETFEGGEENSTDEDQVNGVEESSNDGEADEEEDEDFEGDSSDEDGEEDISMTEEPGNDSGCTAVVALLKGNEVYVANAGDSRCVICRDGKAIDMSIDHKPEDAPELERITKAGGKVSNEGRINGGLNLSRAIGDHSYKQNKDLGPKEQMITALPDVKTLTIDPSTDQFMVLACDGIWNFMSSQDVCDFILPRLVEGRERLSQICEEMFDHCLAPSTVGDGTGCDNMTAIVVRFKDGLISEVAQHSTSTVAAEAPKKRAAEEEPTQDSQESKRPKIDDTLSSSVVTSSV